MASVSSAECGLPMTATHAKLVLNEVIRAMTDPINSSAMSLAATASHPQCPQLAPQLAAVRHMRVVFPMATQILMDVIGNYGFSRTGEGVIQFTLAVKHLETRDDEIKRLNTQLKTYFLPNFSANSSVI